MSQRTARAFIEQSRSYLLFEHLPRIRAAVIQLTKEDVWWRPNDASNSIGNLLLHLSGNVRQWIVGGVGGAEDTRERQAEFDRREPIPGPELLALLSGAVADADAVLEALDPALLEEERVIQGRRVSVLEAIYHVVEHFSMHTGQIAYIAKLRLGKDLGFYEIVEGIPRARWEGRPRE